MNPYRALFTTLEVNMYVSLTAMPLESSECVLLAGCPGNSGGSRRVSFCRLPRTKNPCLSESTAPIFAMYVVSSVGFGADQLKDALFRPSPATPPLGSG